MRLSEAMRLGAMSTKATIGMLYRDGRTCALGAAGIADGLLVTSHAAYDLFRERWPVLTVLVEHPEWDGRNVDLLDTIVELNDVFGWSRERIADFIETIEHAQETAQRAAQPMEATS